MVNSVGFIAAAIRRFVAGGASLDTAARYAALAYPARAADAADHLGCYSSSEPELRAFQRAWGSL